MVSRVRKAQIKLKLSQVLQIKSKFEFQVLEGQVMSQINSEKSKVKC